MVDNNWIKVDSEEGQLFSLLSELLPASVYSDLMTYIDEYAQEVYWQAYDEGYNSGLEE